MELLQKFGVDPVLLIAQIINFLIIFYLLKRFLYKPVLEVLHKREKTIKEGLKQAEEARILLEKAEDREKDIIKKAQTEAKKLLDETRSQRDEMLRISEADTRKQVEKMLMEAREQISFETKEAEKRLASNISTIAVQFLQKSLSQMFSEKDQDAAMKHVLKKMKERVD